MFRIVSLDSDGSSVHPSESSDNVLGVEQHHLKKLALVDDT